MKRKSKIQLKDDSNPYAKPQATSYRKRVKPNISEEEHQANMAYIIQESKPKGGGLGVPGKRDSATIAGYKALNFKSLGSELTGVFEGRKQYRAQKDLARETMDKGALNQWTADNMKTFNRRVDYPHGADTHSLHVGNDIYGQFISGKKGVARGYGYDKLAPALDKRFGGGKQSKSGEAYWSKESKLDHDTRRQLIAQGVKHYSMGDTKAGEKAFTDAGLTDRGRKWAYKMTTVTLAERARETYHGSGDNLVNKALDQVGSKAGRGFNRVYVEKSKKYAPFAGDGGASAFYKKK
ncbi:hypothetical protein [Chitinimonas koreensis]|uniref:hypothetical protein n=1 Tax=Chitinimonas koreensis TaxID=356302 RepID=UPI000419EC19|nr:hypothetical protein [Chitinimonas koreensis]QNM95334.1 hypothetical protein H9L41_15850 [Chitinimonas koreensis]